MDFGLASSIEREQLSAESDRAKREQNHTPCGEEYPSQVQDQELRVHSRCERRFS